MYTYQDYLEVPDTEAAKIDFLRDCINQHKNSKLYKMAVVANEYDRHQNRTIREYQKILYDINGMPVPDVWTANYKMASNFFSTFILQENQYSLGNGISWNDESTKEKLGKDFDTRVQELGHDALVGAVSFGFWNFDHLENFNVREFAPLYDEENGALMAGIRFWQVAPDKPLRATFYEIDGYTDYIWNKKHDQYGEVLKDKRPYKLKIRVSEADGIEIYDGENYPTFPIVPLWGNKHKQSEFVGLQEQIDCYDLIKSGYANTVDEGSLIYWTLNNAGGMGDIDLAEFVRKMKTLHAAVTEDGVHAESHTMESPYQSREALLSKLRSDLFEDAKALDIKNIADGAVTATQIEAAYEPVNSKADGYEYCLTEFLEGILAIVGIDDDPTFTRSILVNRGEQIQWILQSADHLTDDYITEKILALLGDADKAEDMLKQLDSEELQRGFEEDTGMAGEMAGNGAEGVSAADIEGIDSDMLSEYSQDVIKMLEDILEG